MARFQQAAVQAAPPDKRNYDFLRRLFKRPEAGALFAAVIVYAFFCLVTRHTNFVSFDGTAAWLNVAAELGLIAIAVGMLMIAGEFDLSIGAVLGASSIALAIGTQLYGVDIWIMVVLVMLGAAAIGLLNGVVVVRTGLPSFIVTLASLLGVSGAALGFSRLLADTTTMSLVTTPASEFAFAGKLGQANVAILWWMVATIAASAVLNKTAFGNWIYATGGNLEVARAAGIPTGRVKTVLFVTTAVASSLVGIIQAVEFHSGNAANGQGYIFQAPVVAVIGGVLLGGGYGSALGIFLGAVIFGIINVGIFYTGWNTDSIQLFLGGLLLAAVMANAYFRRLALSR